MTFWAILCLKGWRFLKHKIFDWGKGGLARLYTRADRAFSLPKK